MAEKLDTAESKPNTIHADGFSSYKVIDVFYVVGATLAMIVLAATFSWEISHYTPTPIHDDIFDRLRLYRALVDFRTFLAYLGSSHNEHRILTTRLVTFVDEFLFSGREYTQVVATNALQLLAAYVAYRFVFRAEMGKNWPAPDRFLAFSTTALLFVNPNFLYTLIIPFQLQHAIMSFLCVTGAYFVSRKMSSPSDCTLRSLLPMALLLAIVGSFTLGNAPALLIAATCAALVARIGLRILLSLGFLSVVHTVVVMATTTPVGTRASDPVRILKFSLIYWGAPFLRFGPWPAGFETWPTSTYLAAGFGFCIIATAVLFAVLRFARSGAGGRTSLFGFMILIVVIASGVAAALSRSQFGVLEGANKKYASFAALGWLGVLAVVAGLVYQRWSFSRRTVMAVFAAMLALQLPLAISGYRRETRLWETAIDRMWEGGLAAVLQIDHRNKLRELYTDENQLKEYLGYVGPSGRAIFSYFPFKWGDDAATFLSDRRSSTCRSEVEWVVPVPAADLTKLFDAPGTPVAIGGWAWMTEDQQPPPLIIAVDSRNQIVGAARTTRTSSRAEDWLGQKFRQNLGWSGFARLMEPTSAMFFAISRDGKRYCALGGVGDTR